MILQSLYDLYQILAQKGEITPEGRSKAKVSFAILLNDDGQPVDILPLKRTVVRGKREIEIPTILEVFLHESRSSGVKPNFLCDNAAYIFGIDAKKSERAKKCFLESAAYHLRMLSEAETPAAKSVIYFYETWNPDTAYEHPIIHKYERELEEGVNLVFRYKGQYVHTDSSIQKIWDEKRAERDDAIYGRCLITGIKAPIARLHPQIKGVRDAQTSGASLVSYNAAAYESFNKNQNHNAPVSETAAFAYTTSLNHLLSDTEHVQVLGDTTFVYWAKNAEADYADIFTAGINPSSGVDKAKLTRAMREISRGKSYPLYGRTITPDMGFCILGLSPNAARLSVRCFYQDTFEAFSQRIVQHHNRMQIVKAF
ncbi:MAG: type I-C CRISPR-associated protein Cas8c/Csd1 [Clostridiales bacterium]|nr:type I-C CRISPR-associated protein Cas8c/Csd1 [Clostridiales bacterium]